MRKIEKVLLVIPNFRWVNWNSTTFWTINPYNLCLLSAVIGDDFDVTIVDANYDNMDIKDFGEKVLKINPDVVGVTCLTNEYGKAGHIALEKVKEINNDIITIYGGVYATTNCDQVIQDNNIDYVIKGEGEYVFKQLLHFINGTGEIPQKGIVYKNSKKIINLPKADYIKDLDDLPLPDYKKVDFLKYANSIGRASVDAPRFLPYARIMTSRGCPVGCVFCEVELLSGKKFRGRSPENVIKEIIWLKEEYGIKSIIFDDDNLYINKKRAMSIFSLMIRNKLNIKWNAIAVSAFCLNEELLEIMAESGCKYIDVALESGVERVLKDIINKPVKLDHAQKMISKAKALKIDVSANFVIGFPGETWDEIRQSLSFAETLDLDYVKIFIATPLPKTKLYEIAKKGGYLSNNFSFEQNLWKYGQITTDEFTPNDLSILRAYEWDRINFKNENKRKKIAQMMRITEEELEEIRKETRKSLNLL